MSSIAFIRSELAGAIARGVRQCVVIGSRAPLAEAVENATDEAFQVFALGERQPDSEATFVPTEFASESLATALERSDFDKLKASLFVWVGGAYRTFDAAIASLAFIASLPRGSGVVLDYTAERTSVASLGDAALDALASRICEGGTAIKHLIQPQAVAAMLRGLGFSTILDFVQEELSLPAEHLLSAIV